MSKRKSRFGLTAKFSLLISLLILIVSIVLSMSYLRYSSRLIRAAMVERGKSIARGLSLGVEYGLLIENKELLNSYIARYRSEKDILYVYIRNADGKVLASYDKSGGMINSIQGGHTVEHDLFESEIEKALNYRVVEIKSLYDFVCDVVTFQGNEDRDDLSLLELNILPAQGLGRVKKIGTVQFGLSKASMSSSVHKARLNTIYLTAGFIILAILLTVTLAKAMSGPIRRLAIAAGKVSYGDFDHPVKYRSRDEIGDLASAFNKMVADLKESRSALQRRLEVERLIATISTDFIDLAPDEIDGGINRALQAIGEFTGVDRSYVFLASEDGSHWDNTHEWCAEGIEPQIDNLKGLPAETFPWWMERLNRFESIHIPCVDDLPVEASAEKELLKSQGIRSLIVVPLVYGGSLIGFLGFDSVRAEKRWAWEDTLLLEMVGEIIVNALERKRMETALVEERNLLRTVINTIPDQVYVKDTESRFLIINNTVMRYMGAKTQEEVVGKTDFDFSPQESAEHFRAYEMEIMTTGRPVINKEEFGIDPETGDKVWILTTKVPLRDSRGKIIGLVGVNRDVSALKQAEIALQEQLEAQKLIAKELEEKTKELALRNQELDAFIYTVSHDLKAPVVSLQGFSTLLLNDYKDRIDETGRLYIERIQKNSERMGRLIEDLLELSRIGRIKGQEEEVLVSDIVLDIVDELGPQLEKRGTKLNIKGEMPKIKCDRTRLTQVFANLISNANKFMGDDNNDPNIEVGCSDQDGYHRFYVKDNGIGIDKEYHEKIFQIFYRLDDIETEGTGVGLAIVKKIIENFGGKIWVDSEKGKGTTVYFTIPKARSI